MCQSLCLSTGYLAEKKINKIPSFMELRILVGGVRLKKKQIKKNVSGMH